MVVESNEFAEEKIDEVDIEDNEEDTDDYRDDSEEDEENNKFTTTPSLTDEELDTIADTAIAALRDILQYFNLGEITIDEYEGEEGELILDITGEDLAVLIGRHGRTLDALQLVISAITVQSLGFRFPVIIDVEGYKNRQRQKLESLAHSSANKAAKNHHNVKLRPMNPYERRIIHVALRDDVRVETASEGEGSGRHVVIVPSKKN